MASIDHARAPAAHPDLALGSFTPVGPWTVDPDAMSWRFRVDGRLLIDELRADTARQAVELLAPRRLPPGLHVVTVAARLGQALVGWVARERGTPRSRAGLSRRLRADRKSVV